MTAKDIIAENEKRNEVIYAPFNPLTGEGAPLKRKKLVISDFVIPVQYVPERVLRYALVKKPIQYGSINAFL